ncbi:MAG: DUF3035 domain-containing protein [Proteobacteria bacterium]|nr:DUF3035 domain-containing protein [Pseudomonadota bacterium]
MTRQFMKISITVLLATGIVTGLTACSDFRRAIGDGKSAPDEFQVVVRAPLSLPPGFSDSPEDIVKQAQTTGSDAKSSTAQLIGSATADNSSFASLFDFSGVPEDIRTKVDEETYGIQLESRLPLQILFGGMPDVGPVLDKMEEDLRLRRARLDGKTPTEDGSKAIDPASNQPLTIN